MGNVCDFDDGFCPDILFYKEYIKKHKLTLIIEFKVKRPPILFHFPKNTSRT